MQMPSSKPKLSEPCITTGWLQEMAMGGGSGMGDCGMRGDGKREQQAAGETVQEITA